ncbi:MAG TPA: chitosanase [Nevskiaceae bacterium]|nr:chitosanase [Nevskiaceae bacterium]
MTKALPRWNKFISISTAVLILAAPLPALAEECDNQNDTFPGNNPGQTQPMDLTNADTRKRAEQIISTFENSTTKIQYNYAEKLTDGRGITAGRSGFTSGTNDLLLVVQEYLKNTKKTDPILASYVPALEAVKGTDSTVGLDGFIEAWKQTYKNDKTVFKSAQDTVYTNLYFNPAMKQAQTAGVKTALGQMIILDTIIQHGEGDDPDGLPAILTEVQKAVGPVQPGKEADWLQTFLDARQKHLENAADPATRDEWKESVDRVKALRSILNTGNLDLKLPLAWQVYGDKFNLTNSLPFEVIPKKHEQTL